MSSSWSTTCSGRVIPPGGIPLAVGAVVMNVETALNVAAAGRQPVTEKYLSIAGAVAEPVTLRVPLGVTLAAVRGGRRRGDHRRRQLHGRRRDDGPPRGQPRRPGRQDHRRRDRAARRSRGDSPPPAGLAADRPHRPQRLRPVQFLHRAVSPLAAGPSHRAAPGHAEPGVQPDRRGQRHRHGLLLRVQSVQPLFLPGRPRSRRTSARRTSGGWRPRSGAGRTRPSIRSGRSCTWPTARRPWPG